MVGLGVIGVVAGRSAQQAVNSTVGAIPGLGAVVPAAGGFRI
jgi:hypothetical protein